MKSIRITSTLWFLLAIGVWIFQDDLDSPTVLITICCGVSAILNAIASANEN